VELLVSSRTTSRLRRSAVVVPVLALALPLAACGSDSDPAPSGATSGGSVEAVRIDHAFGSTEVPEDPQRVVTWGWGSADAAIALGVVPVAISAQAYGGDEDGVLPWVRERVEADGADLPAVLPDVQEVPVEAIAAARPDVILAPYSGITDAEYQQLSRIAPTVAYPQEAWATPWKDTIRIVGEALGRSDEAEALLADIDATVAEQAAAHPEFEGTSIALVASTPDAFYVYTPADPRVQFVLDLGFESAESVEALASGDDTFFSTVSTERLAELQSDVLVSYAASQAEADAFLGSAPAQLLPQVERGAVASVVGTQLVSSVSPPTALSLTWALDEYVAELAKAVAAAP
jgi:iron complex transport system substrate-binding protein